MTSVEVEMPDSLGVELGDKVELPELLSTVLEYGRSREIRLAFLKALAATSEMTEEDALELGREINESMLEDLQAEGLV